MALTSKMAGTLERSPLRWFWLMTSGLAMLLLVGHTQLLTGDEPRYLLYARALLEHGRLTMGLPEWQALYLQATRMKATGLPIDGRASIVMNGVYLPALLSPVAWAFSLRGLRAVTLLAGVVGLAFLFRLCRRVAPDRFALAATGIAAGSIPLLPYLHLFYMETYLFALVAVTWQRLQDEPRSAAGDTVTALLLIAMPFVQLRGSAVAAILYGWLLWRLARQGRGRRAAALALLGVAGAAAMVGGNIAIYGTVMGPVNTARPPLPSEWFAVLSMQLFNVRHGLLAFAPVWLLGYAGLILGALRGVPIARQGLVLAAVAAVTGVGINPGECWPARFWVLSVPMLAVGLAIWAGSACGALLRTVSIVLLAVTLLNSALFVRAPNEFLDDRTSSNTYQLLFNKFGVANPGLMLPVEDGGAAHIAEARDLTLGTALLVALLVAAAQGWPVCAALALFIVAAAADLTRVAVVPPDTYQVVAADARGFRIRLDEPARAVYLQFGHGWVPWFTPPVGPWFNVRVNGADEDVAIPANSVVGAAAAAGVRSVAVAETDGELDLAAEVGFRLAVYQSTSRLRAWWLAAGW